MNERLERALVVLIALHSVGVAVTLLFLTEWGLRIGGWGDVHPLFFARQAGIFHLVVATGYLIEYFRYRGVVLLVTTKGFAVVFLVAMSLVENVPSLVPASAVADGLMGLVVLIVHVRVTGAARAQESAD